MTMSERSAAARRHVDMWAFQKLHATNIELAQRLKMADDSQFGSNMDVCGTVSEHDAKTDTWEDVWSVGIRQDLWKPSSEELEQTLKSVQKKRQETVRRTVKRSGRLTADQSAQLEAKLAEDEVMQLTADEIEKRRLILKLFRTTGQRLDWQGTIEELTTSEIHNSIGTGKPLLSFVVILDGHPLVTHIHQNHRTFRIPSIFTFCFIDQKNDRPWYVAIKRKWFSIGADFVIETEGRPIGNINGALIGLGYNASIDITQPELAANRDFLDLITLFTITVGYQKAARQSLKRRIDAVQNGQAVRHVIADEEVRLMQNPRRRSA
jgi:hypothetical protein